MKINKFLFILIVNLMFFGFLSAQENRSKSLRWGKTMLLFEYDGSEDWKSKWMLDGVTSKIINNEDGMELIAGPEYKNDSCHAVLWTQQSFSGNIVIEYDYTRTDSSTCCVNILYFFATGKGTTEFPEDIAMWNDKRTVPSMRTYFNNMNTYHISYATYSPKNETDENDYIRLRRYDPNNTGLKGTDIPEDIFLSGMFKNNITYHIQIFKYGSDIEMHIQNRQDTQDKLVCKWDVSDFPPCDSGRIGLRHMYTRSARYKNFKVWRLEPK